MLAVVGDPRRDRPLDRHRAHDRECRADGFACRERAVGEVAMEADRDAEPCDDVHHGRTRRSSCQCRNLAEACHTTRPARAPGKTATILVAMRSAVPLAHGSMSCGAEPVALLVRAASVRLVRRGGRGGVSRRSGHSASSSSLLLSQRAGQTRRPSQTVALQAVGRGDPYSAASCHSRSLRRECRAARDARLRRRRGRARTRARRRAFRPPEPGAVPAGARAAPPPWAPAPNPRSAAGPRRADAERASDPALAVRTRAPGSRNRLVNRGAGPLSLTAGASGRAR